MPKQMDWTEEGGNPKPKRGRKRLPQDEPPITDREPQPSLPEASSAEAGTGDAGSPGFGDVAHLTKKGLRVVPVVTGAVVDQAGNFLFYVDGHEEARSGVQAQINYQLGSGPAREEYLAPARIRAGDLLEKLRKPR
jgi:hypothetical protein